MAFLITKPPRIAMVDIPILPVLTLTIRPMSPLIFQVCRETRRAQKIRAMSSPLLLVLQRLCRQGQILDLPL